MNGLANSLTMHIASNARAAQSVPWARIFALTGLVAAAGLLANRGGEIGTLLLVMLCVGIPLLDRPHALGQSLRPSRRGWWLALVLGFLLLCLPWGFMWGLMWGLTWASNSGSTLGVRLGINVAGFLPPVHHALDFMAQHLIRALPLVVAEEIFFRGYLQETLLAAHAHDRGRGRRWMGLSRRIWVASLLFGLAHVVARLQPVALVTMLGGLLFGWITEVANGKIGPAILLHLCINVALATLIWLVSINLSWSLF